MTTRSCEEIAGEYDNLNRLVKSLGSSMKAPFYDIIIYGFYLYNLNSENRGQRII